jgi:hypothetical protein
MNARSEYVAEPCKQDTGMRVLTAIELEEVAGGTPSIPIPPPRPAYLQLPAIQFG